MLGYVGLEVRTVHSSLESMQSGQWILA
jgi:hypothetical protein